MMFFLKSYLRNLNFYQSTEGTNEDEYDRRSNIIATRVYLVLFIMILTSFTLTLSLIEQTSKLEIKNPTEDQIKALPVDAQCPCSQLSLSYGEFTSLEPSFHQICSSDFISNRWIKILFFGSNISHFQKEDFRVSASAHFQMLAGLCEHLNDSIEKDLISFKAIPLISPQVLSQSFVESQINASIDQFILSANTTFQTQLQIMRNMIQPNQLISALKTNTFITFTYGFIDSTKAEMYIRMQTDPHTYVGTGTFCFCHWNDCIEKWSNHASDFSGLEILGFASGCLPINSLLQSTLECLYNQSCLDEILSAALTNDSFLPMKILETSRFDINSTVQILVDNLMVEIWKTNFSYQKYFSQCAPLSCTYSQVERPDFIYVMTSVVGLLGVLTIVLEIIVLPAIKFLRRKRNNQPNPRILLVLLWYFRKNFRLILTLVSIRLNQLKTKVKRIFFELNFFENQSLDNRIIYYQRIGTKLYVIILIVSIIIFALYSFLITDVYRQTLFNPTESEYMYLQENFPNTLVCPCTVLSVSYNTFISIEFFYHQICSSDLISAQWIKYWMFMEQNYQYFDGYEANIGNKFALLSMFCESARQTVDNALRLFLSNEYVASKVIPKEVFVAQIQSLIEIWQTSTTNRFLSIIQLIKTTNQGNQLLSDKSNFIFIVYGITDQVKCAPVIYRNCSCAISALCRTLISIPMLDFGMYRNGSFSWHAIPVSETLTIPNFFIGCSYIETLLKSTLECFYDRNCTNVLIKYFNSDYAFELGDIRGFYIYTENNSQILDKSLNSPNETVEQILNRLMIDSWKKNISFSSYYNACAPVSCTFEYIGRREKFIVIMSIIGFFGGISDGFKIIILIILGLIEKISQGHGHFMMMQLIRNIFVFSNEQKKINRIQFILLVSALLIVYLISFIKQDSRIIEIQNPSFSMYQNLLKDYSDSLQCPCSQLSIKYESFLRIHPRINEICSSEFVSDQWIAYVYGTGNFYDPFPHTDFRATASGQFQLLASLCQLSNEILNDSLLQLHTRNYIDVQLSSLSLLNERIQTTMDEFNRTTSNFFISSLAMIRLMTSGNMLMTLFATNWKFIDIDSAQREDDYEVYTTPLSYEGCNCGTSSLCTQSSRGMKAGCYPLENLLQSTIQCFYNQECIDSNNTFKALNSSSIKSNHFNANSTILSMVNQLMVEEYFINMSYENYYNQCAPSLCTYSKVGHRSTIDILTILITFYGGFVLISRWIAVTIVKLTQNRIGPINSQN